MQTRPYDFNEIPISRTRFPGHSQSRIGLPGAYLHRKLSIDTTQGYFTIKEIIQVMYYSNVIMGAMVSQLTGVSIF